MIVFINNCILFRFKTHIAKEAIQETLLKYLKDREYSQIQAEVLSKTIASEIKDRLKGFIYFPLQINKFDTFIS